MNEKLASMMSKIQALLAKADSTEFPDEAAALYAKAEELMRKYRITEEQLIAEDQFAAVPVMHSMLGYDTNSDFYNEYRMTMYWIADHCGVEYVIRYNREGEQHGFWFDLFGYEGDLRMAEWLWSSARLVFGSHLEPQVDPRLSDQVNAYNLRQAGVLRKDIARKLWEENTPALRSKAQRLYLAECAARGERPLVSGLGTDADMYRQSYAQGFVSRLSDRLRASRDATDSVGGALVLHGRAERVKEAKYQAYPRLRPMPASEIAKLQEDRANLSAPKVDGRRKPWTQADERAYQRRNNDSARAGRSAGGAAAAKVEIDRTHIPAHRVNPAPQRAIEL
jgi:hypothetical protein